MGHNLPVSVPVYRQKREGYREIDIQKQIEAIDIKLYNLLVQRTELVKKNPYPNRIENILGQEAMGIRRMLKYHTGDFPEYVLAKIWREI